MLFLAACWAQQPPVVDETFKTEVTPRRHEVCLGCLKAIGPGDKVYLVEGQRVPVHVGHCDDVVRADPQRFLSILKPRGGLFGGETAPRVPATDLWLFLGMYVVLGLVFSAVCAHRALNSGRRPVRWFFAGLFFNAAGYLALLTRAAAPVVPSRYAGMTKIPSTAEPEPCPACGEANHPTAARCQSCGGALRPAGLSEVAKTRSH
jgi:hypothetical protein